MAWTRRLLNDVLRYWLYRSVSRTLIGKKWRTVKYEHVYLHEYALVPELEKGFGEYSTFYNQQRLHRSLSYQPAAGDDGHFARFYDVEAFQRRIVDVSEEVHLHTTVVTCRLDGEDQPDMDSNLGSKLNHPLRALVLDKL